MAEELFRPMTAAEHIVQAEIRLHMVETGDAGYTTAEIHAARCREAEAHAAIARAKIAQESVSDMRAVLNGGER